MALAPGTNLGTYEIVAPIGRGGMGEVYRARDTKLDREVALKVLPRALADDAFRRSRFEREAKLLASLNHPNIATIHGFEVADGAHALILELVEGPTLEDRIREGPIPVDETVAIARQIADALEAGHDAGVIHRDLKPANVKLKESGPVKVLDYGLAKALEGDEPEEPGGELESTPTMTRGGTLAGTILGTPAYMSPEQARGKRVDKRTDIWAFGAVVYEMLAGKPAFTGDDVSETLASVLKTEVDWSALPASTPASLRQLLRRCLERDTKRRLRDIGDARVLIDLPDVVRIQSYPTTLQVGALAGALLLGTLVTSAVFWGTSSPEAPPQPLMRFALSLPSGASLTGPDRNVMALSPDGTRLTFAANDQLFVRTMDAVEATPLPGTEGARSPFFSPDGEWVGFWADQELKRVAVGGGAPVSLCDAVIPWGAHWGADGTIVFGQGPDGILRVPEEGGEPTTLIPLEGTEEGHGPQILPGGGSVLFTLAENGNWDQARIVVQSIRTGARTALVQGGRDARYLRSGHLVYVSNGSLLAVPFQPATLEVDGGPRTMAEGLRTGGRATGAAQYAVSDTGTLAYVPGGDVRRRTLVWVDRDGNEESLPAEPGAYSQPRVSPDGARIALDVFGQESDVWLLDIARETLTRFTFAPGLDTAPMWTPDGKAIVFTSDRNLFGNLYRKSADGSGEPEPVYSAETAKRANSISHDGRRLVFREGASDTDLMVLTDDGAVEPLVETEFQERNGELSPDSKWLAYQSNASGTNEVYVRPFPNVDDGQWSISNGGGRAPLWSPDGKELFYVAPNAVLMKVDVDTRDGFTPGVVEELFGVESYFTGGGERSYDISPDGDRFVWVKESAGDDVDRIVFVLNWAQELERVVPSEETSR